MTLAVRAVTARFRFSDGELVRQVVDAVERGVSLDEEARTIVIHRLKVQDADVGSASSAVHALYTATGSGLAALDAVSAAQHAVGDDWPTVRRDLYRLVREVGWPLGH
ncbi:hypothetical protein [Micromonospora taraxaci]|uniref:hypothetical protein n=1 Tax=Micromonospora taraxaci TaxID=1316803 RepID=UPI0033BC5340